MLRDIILSPAEFSGDVQVMARRFFAVFVLALVPNYIVIISTSLFRAGGEVKLTLVAMAIISLMNIALNFLFVFGFGSFPGIGYRGIAFATVGAMTFGMVICLFLFRKSMWKGIFSGVWNVSSDLIARIIRLSWPAVLIQLSWNAGTIFLYNILSRLEQANITAMAALTNGLRVEAVIYLPAFALNMAASVLTGQNLGAGDPVRAEKIGWKIMLSGTLFVTLMSFPMLLWPEVFSGIVSRDASVLDETARYLRITMLVEPFMAVSVVLAGCLQGAGDTKGAMVVIVTALWGIRLPLAYLLAVTMGYGAPGVWIAMAVSMFFQSIGMTLRFRQGRWKELKP
jgi:putative MATE family efflux protein